MVTGSAVLVAALVISSRSAVAPGRPAHPAPVPIVIPEQAAALEDATLACLAKDPRVRRVLTQRLVEALAGLAENGSHQTPESYYALGLRRFAQSDSQEDYERAEAAYLRAVELRPEWAMAYNALGIVNHSMHRVEAAEKAFKKAIELDPAWSRPHNDLAILYRMTNRLELAEEEALRALELDPEDVANYNNYGNLLLEQKRHEDAEEMYKLALEREPDQPAPYFNLACLASIRGETRPALAYLTCAIILDDAYRSEALREKHLANLREDPEFQHVLNGG